MTNLSPGMTIPNIFKNVINKENILFKFILNMINNKNIIFILITFKNIGKL